MARIGGRGRGEGRGNSFRGLKLQPRTPWKVLDRKRSSFQLSTRLYTTILPDAPSATYIIVRRKIRRISASQRRGATFSPDQLLITTPDTGPLSSVFQKKGEAEGFFRSSFFQPDCRWDSWKIDFKGIRMINFSSGWKEEEKFPFFWETFDIWNCLWTLKMIVEMILWELT